MIYVLLRLRNYFLIVKATSNKHFSLLDAGAIEIDSGNWCAMLDLERSIDLKEDGLIELLSPDSLIQTSEECLHKILELNPDYLNDKTFI